MNDDSEFLRRFAEEGSQESFAELVRRKVNLVYAAALRQTGGDAHLAQDVTQGVFLALAAQAHTLWRHRALTGWLHTTTRFVAAKAVRAQARWQRREKEANDMDTATDRENAAWLELRPVIDDVLGELEEPDRTALLLRYFEGRSLADVGAAIGLTDNAARMRVERALEKLRPRLARRGITSTAGILGAALASQPAVAAPLGLVATIAGSAVAGVTAGSAGALANSSWIFHTMSTTKLALGSAVALAIFGLGTYLGANVRGTTPSAGSGRDLTAPATLATLREENRRLKAELSQSAAVPSLAPRFVGPANLAAGGNALNSLRVLTDLQRRKLVSPEVKLMSEDAKITDDFRELFGLTSTEQAVLQAGIETARASVKELERENLTVTRGPGDEVKLEIKPFPEAGGVAYDAMLKTFADTLGPERYQAFLALGAEQTEKTLNRFGAALRNVSVSREIQPDGEMRYHIDAHASSPPRDNWSYNSLPLTEERFREEASWFLSLLPEDFLARK